MRENFIHLLSDQKSMISINGKNIGIIDNKNIFELDIISRTDKIFITYSPIINKSNTLGYTFELNTKNAPFVDNEYVEIIPFPNNHYDIIMKPFHYYETTNSQIILNQIIEKYTIAIVSNTFSKISIYNGSNIIFEHNSPKIISAKAIIKKGNIIITGLIDSENYYLLILNLDNLKILFDDTVQSINELEDNLEILQNSKDISHHSIVKKVDLSEKSIQEYHVYENNIVTQPLSPLLIPYDFLECIKNNDESKTRKYLSNNYSSTPFEKLKSYFGSIDNIYLNRHEVLQDKLNYTIKNNSTYKNYNFIMNHNIITDIEEVF